MCDKLLGRTKTLSLPKCAPAPKLPEMFANAFAEKTQKIRDDLSRCKMFDDYELFDGAYFDCFEPVNESDIKTLILEAPKNIVNLILSLVLWYSHALMKLYL